MEKQSLALSNTNDCSDAGASLELLLALVGAGAEAAQLLAVLAQCPRMQTRVAEAGPSVSQRLALLQSHDQNLQI